MAILGIELDRVNPEFTISDFLFWMPQFSAYLGTERGICVFNKIYSIANQRVFHSIFGVDWELAMSYVIAHYMTLIAQQQQAPSGGTLQGIAGGGVTRGVLQSAGVGDFQKSYDLSKTMLDSQDSLFWNQTSYGTSFMALLKTKAVPSMFVVTTNPIPEERPKKNPVFPWY